MGQSDRNPNSIQSIERAFRILEQFDRRNYELSITDLHDRSGLPISTVHRFLSTLEGLGYIRQNEENGKYRLGLNAFILGTRVQAMDELRSVARVYMRTLFEKYNETTHFVIERDMQVLCIEKLDAQRRLVYTPGIGETHRLYATSVGKCILAFYYDEQKLETVLRNLKLTPLTKKTITDRERLRQEIHSVRTLGYAVDDEESEVGLRCFGAPVFGHNGSCVGALSVSIPAPRMVYDWDEVIADVKATAHQISHALGAP